MAAYYFEIPSPIYERNQHFESFKMVYNLKFCRISFNLKGQGDAMVQRSCSNGYAICKILGSSPTYDQWSFSPVTRFLHSKNDTQRMFPNKLAQKLSRAL